MNIFTEEQENYLGDIIADQFERNFNVVEGDLAGRLQEIADKLTKQMPPSKILIRVKLVDIPEVNAFAFPGGRVYVTRKLVVAGRNDDEIAGVIAHEIGHIIARQSSQRMSQLMRQVLNVTAVKDRADVFAKYHQLLENAARKPKAFQVKESHEQAEQVVADTVGVYGVAKAGYRPQAYSEFWDRMTENRGKTGNAFSDFFGATKPESKRLREMLKYASSLPASCVVAQSTNPEGYKAWRLKVIENESLERTENIPGLISRKIILTPLRGEIRHLKFSPDKKRALAQDDANIYVMTVEPFSYLFRIKAQNANRAHFSPDSSKIVFHDNDLRVEEWDIAARKRTQVHEIARRLDCLQSELSYDAKYMGCWNQENVLQVLEVGSGDAIYSEKDFFKIETQSDYNKLLFARFLGPSMLRRMMTMAFSPDSKTFAAAHGPAVLALDLGSRTKIPVSGRARSFMERSFAFLDNGKMVGVKMYDDEGEILTFPEGKTIKKLTLGFQEVFAPAHGDFVIARPVRDYPVGVMESTTGKFFLANAKWAFDIYDNHYLSERKDGEIGLYDRTAPMPQLQKAAPLPRGDLSRIRAFAISPDMKWMAISEASRGAVWNMETGVRVIHIRAFE
ncbi:MAG TPA: M48 family metalloprotease, partial [Terriglobales bacterium]|nr:M48 family metalloprotease [Terriglobales bacterium]